MGISEHGKCFAIPSLLLIELFRKLGMDVLGVEYVADQHHQGDFLVRVRASNGKQRTISLEVKTDRRGYNTRNLIAETVCNLNDQIPGWIYAKEVDYLVFLLLDGAGGLSEALLLSFKDFRVCVEG